MHALPADIAPSGIVTLTSVGQPDSVSGYVVSARQSTEHMTLHD